MKKYRFYFNSFTFLEFNEKTLNSFEHCTINNEGDYRIIKTDNTMGETFFIIAPLGQIRELKENE